MGPHQAAGPAGQHKGSGDATAGGSGLHPVGDEGQRKWHSMGSVRHPHPAPLALAFLAPLGGVQLGDSEQASSSLWASVFPTVTLES